MEIVFLATLLTSALGSLHAYSPDSLREEFEQRYQKGAIPHSLANFGNPPYGSAMVGRVFYDKTNKLGCTPFSPISWEDDPDPVNTPILLVDRGECYFTVKVKNAQNIGATAVIIVDDRNENPEHVVMQDNGAGGDIFIPSMLVSKSDGDIIKLMLEDTNLARHVAMSVTFDMPQQDEDVHYEFWISSDRKEVYEMLMQDRNYRKQLKKIEAEFTPHYVHYSCMSCKMDGYRSDEKDCVSGGRYCARDPDQTGPFTGREVVMEDLRQLCVFKYAEEKGKNSIYFNYLLGFATNCYYRNDFSKKCSENAMRYSGIPAKKVQECVDESFNYEDIVYGDNTILAEEREAWHDSGLSFYPSITINGQAFRGDWEIQEVMVAVCAGFTYEERPEVCQEVIQDYDDKDEEESEGAGTGTYLLVLVLCLSLIGAVLVLYRMWMKKELKSEMRNQINSTVSQYFALNESAQRAERPLVRASYV